MLETGKMSAAVSGDGFGFVIFGSCTSVPDPGK
jgi:hypothetical protein